MGSPHMHNDEIRKVLALNLKTLLTLNEITQNQLAKKTTHMSQKAINNVAEARHGCGVDALAEMSDAFSVPPWMMLYEKLPEVVNNLPQLAALVDAYARASVKDRDLIVSVARKVR